MLPLILALMFALAAGLVGCIALMKRLLLAGDVVSHLALPGLGIALLMGRNSLLGAAASLFLGILLVWQLQKKTELATEAAVGVVFATALAIGAAVTPKEDLVEALFGELRPMSMGGFFLGLAGVFVVIVSVLALKDRLTLSIFSPDLAAATGVNVARIDLCFLLVFGLTVLIGLRFMGALLASALIIVPAATARQLTGNLWGFFLVSSGASVLSVLIGFLFNAFLVRSSTAGPAIVIVSAVLFALSLGIQKR